MCIELFGGILSASHALDALGIVPTAVFFSEIDSDAIIVASTAFPLAFNLGDVEKVDEAQILNICEQFQGCSFLLTGGVPCTNVSLLNASREGAFGPQSRLRECFRNIWTWILKHSSGNCKGLMECTRMDSHDQVWYDSVFQCKPFLLCSRHFSWITRPRLWWMSHSPTFPPGTKLIDRGSCVEIIPSVTRQPLREVLEPGWWPAALRPNYQPKHDRAFMFRCLTTHKTRTKPMFKPRGLAKASPATIERWRADNFAQAPYQYGEANLVKGKRHHELRRLLSVEEERLMMFPTFTTAPLLCLEEQTPPVTRRLIERQRRSLLGNAWHLGVATFLLRALLGTAMKADLPCALPPPPEWHFPGFQPFKTVYTELRLSCPFVLHCMTSGLSCAAGFGPDPSEQMGHRTMATASCVQPRFRGITTRLLPYGLPPELHFALAVEAACPLSRSPPLPADLDFAVKTVVSQGKKIRAWRQRQWRKLSTRLDRLLPLEQLWTELRSCTSASVSSHLCISAYSALLYSIMWPDLQAPTTLVEGAHIVGDLQPFGIFRDKITEASINIDELEQSNGEWTTKLLAQPPPPLEEAIVVWEKTEKEKGLGIIDGYFTREELDAEFGPNGWRPMKRFAQWQPNHNAWRAIDNARSSQHNAATSMEETIYTASTDLGVAIAKAFYSHSQLVGHAESLDLQIATKDMSRAYRQIAVHPEHAHLSIVMIWHPEEAKWVFGKLNSLAFGLSSAVLVFNRYPISISAIARRWLAIPVISFFDDFKITDPAYAEGSASFYFDALTQRLGWLFDSDKDVPLSSSGTFLGNVETFHNHTLLIQGKPERVNLVRASILQALDSGHMHTSTALSLRGKLLHLTQAYKGRVGRGQLFGLNEHIATEASQMSTRLRNNLLFHLALIDMAPWRQINLRHESRPQATVFTDASCEPQTHGAFPKVLVCFIVCISEPYFRQGGVVLIPDDVLASFEYRQTYIAQGEAFGPLLALHYCQKQLRQRDTTFFIDNMGVLASLTSGSSSIADLGTIIHGFHLMAAALGCQPWMEHVESKANCSDGGSRVGESCPLAAKLGVKLTTLPFPEHWPTNVLDAPPSLWLPLLTVPTTGCPERGI